MKWVSHTRLVEQYLTAKEIVISSGYGHEIDWQDTVSFDAVTESDFLREGGWVIFSSGMREATIRSKFPQISDAFLGWSCAKAIISQEPCCRRRALCVFAHRGKVDAVIRLAEEVLRNGFPETKKRILREGISYIESLPFMGPATSYHFAKNLGLDVAKPDRHLLRVAAASGFQSPATLCRTIAEAVGERLSVVDLVIWRFATLRSDYLSYFAA